MSGVLSVPSRALEEERDFDLAEQPPEATSMGAALEAGSSLPWAAALDATSRFTGFANNEGVRCHAFSYTLRDGTRVCSSPRLPLLYHARGHVSQLDPRRPLLPAALPRAAHIRRASPGPRIPFRDRGVVASSRSRLRSSSFPRWCTATCANSGCPPYPTRSKPGSKARIWPTRYATSFSPTNSPVCCTC